MKELEELVLKNLMVEEEIETLGRKFRTSDIISVNVAIYEGDTETVTGVINLPKGGRGNDFIGFKVSKIDLDEETDELPPSLNFSEIPDLNKLVNEDK